MAKAVEYRGYAIRLYRKGKPPWEPVRFEAEALAAGRPKIWTTQHQGKGSMGLAIAEAKWRIDQHEEELARCTCRPVMMVAGRTYCGGIDDCPVHGFGPSEETSDGHHPEGTQGDSRSGRP